MACFGSKVLQKNSAPVKPRKCRRTSAKARTQGSEAMMKVDKSVTKRNGTHKTKNHRKNGEFSAGASGGKGNLKFENHRRNGDSIAGGYGRKGNHKTDASKQPSRVENRATSQNPISRKKLDPETIHYFSEISSLLEKSTIDEEERAILCANALEESSGKELQLACDKIFSRLFENLLMSCDKDQLCHFLSRCVKDFPSIAVDQSGSHVAEASLRSLALAFQTRDVKAEGDKIIEQVLTKICQEVAENALDVMCSPYGSHVLRSLLCLCNGTLLESLDKFHASNPASTLSGRLSGLPFQLSRRQSGQAPVQAFPNLLKFSVSKILECCREHIAVMRADTSAGLVLQTILKLLEGDKEAVVKVITVILECGEKNILKEGKMLEDAAVQNVLDLMKDQASSHLMEVILEVAPDSVYMEILNRFFRRSLFEIASHKSGNFVVQSLISSARHQGQVNMIWDELGSQFAELLKERKSGVVASLIAACRRFHTHERECCKALAHAVNPDSVSPNCIVPRILHLESYSCSTGRSDWQWPSRSKMSVLGCLMLQSIFKYPNEFIQQFCSSFASIEVNHILEAAKDPGGSRVIEAFLSSNAPLKHKHRVISKFRGHFGHLAQQPSSSFTVAKCFLAADVALKEAITSELASVQGELSRSKYGSHLLKNCDVARYAKGPDQWRSSQSSKQSTRQAFAEVFGSDVEARKEDDCGVVSCKEEDATEAPMKGMKKSKRVRELQNTGDEMDNSVLNKEDLSKIEHSMAELGFAIHKRAKRDVNHKAEMNVDESENHKVNTANEVSLSKGKMKKKSGEDDIEEIFCKKGKAKKSNKRRKMTESRDELADVESVQVTIDSSMNNVLSTLEQGSKKKKRPAIDHRTPSAKKEKQQKQIVYM